MTNMISYQGLVRTFHSLTKNAWQKGRDQMLALNVNIPFSHWLRSDSKSQWRHASASYSMSHDLNGRMTNLVGVGDAANLLI